MHALALGLLSVLAGIGCGGGSNDDTAATGPMITGTIKPDGETVSGEFEGYHAFAFDQGSSFIAYISSNPGASCDNVTDYLMKDSEPYDPVDVLAAERCDFFMTIHSGWEGGIDASWTDGDAGVDVIGSGVAIGCAMGEGEWVYERRDGDDKDYYYSGRWWQGAPSTYSFDFSGDKDSGYVMDIEMSAYSGSFIYEEFANDSATGDVSGNVRAEWCSGLASTGLFY